MESGTRRDFVTGLVTKTAALTAFATGAPALLAQQTSTSGTSGTSGASATAASTATGQTPRRSGGSRHIVDGIFYFSGTGANDGYPDTDHVTVNDPFEKHVTRTMDALKKTVERAGCSMDSIIHLTVFLCLPLSDSIPMPTGKARFDAHKAQYDALNKIYGTYFTPGKTPSRACMALEWIPGDSLIEIVGSAQVLDAFTPAAEK
ncbi:MAG: RidA family protein [Candidatus Acidiferrales bacterium]|jgi:enamine deaminase RidA (YjgF/YER057c/UK114 family)